VIDKSQKARDRLKSDFSGDFLVGFVFDRYIMETAGIKDASAFASVTSGDNSNIVSARIAKEHNRPLLLGERDGISGYKSNINY
jgi:trk system potassium uptake protein TrkA